MGEATPQRKTRSRETEPKETVKQRMILIGEVVFAEHGIGGASMREIAQKAGQRNHNAVQYHFGSREGLVKAIFDYRMLQMEPARGRLLVQAERVGLLKDARTLLDTILLPQLDLEDSDGHHSYASFLSQYLLRSQSTLFGDFGSELPPNLQRVHDLLRERLSYLPTAVAQRRLVSTSLMFLKMLVTHRGNGASDEPGELFEQALEDTMEMVVASMCMPLRARVLGEGPAGA